MAKTQTITVKEGTFENAIGGSNGEAKTRKSPVYKITPEQFKAQVQQMDHKHLFSIRESITAELERRQSAAEKLVEELKGGKA